MVFMFQGALRGAVGATMGGRDGAGEAGAGSKTQ